MNGFITIEALGLSVAIVDLIVVLYALIMALIGIKKGFIKMLFKLFGTLAVVIGAVLLASSLSEALIGPIGHFIQNPFYGFQCDMFVGVDGIYLFLQII